MRDRGSFSGCLEVAQAATRARLTKSRMAKTRTHIMFAYLERIARLQHLGRDFTILPIVLRL